jgi:predicted patatin/cPLA2 family phospholipase
MDLNFLLDEVMTDTIPLDWQAVIDSELPLKVVASSLTTLNSEILTNFSDRRDLAECLKASANVPEIVGGPRRWRGHDLVDAAVFEPLPIKAALRDGCTHVLALCSRTHSAGPAWGKYLTNALSSAIKYMVLNPVSGNCSAGWASLVCMLPERAAATILAMGSCNRRTLPAVDGTIDCS